MLAGDWLGLIGVTAGIFASIASAYAVLQGIRTKKVAAQRQEVADQRNADREETQQALEAQSALLDRYEARIDGLERRNATLHKKINDALGELVVLRKEHEDCQRRLATLGGA